MAHAIHERLDAMHARAADVLDQAIRDHQPWVAHLGRRPADPAAGRSWQQAALAVAAYRDAWNVTADTPFGDPANAVQRADATRIQGLLARTRVGTDTPTSRTPSSVSAL